MLADKDRIFTNIYGLHDPGLKGAMARGQWDGTKATHRTRAMTKSSSASRRPACVAAAALASRPASNGRLCRRIDPRPSYLVVNADESEPGSCKDREILRHDPHTLVEGCLIASFAMRAHTCYVYFRGEYIREREAFQRAVDEAYDAGLIGKNNKNGWDFDLYVHHGAGAYICGEETALLESLEGKKGQPRMKPPFPAGSGLYGAPTTVNNVESIAVTPTILRRGAEWFAGLGKPNNTGTKLFQISGHVERPMRRRRRNGHPAARTPRAPRRRRPRRLGQPPSGHPWRLVGALSASRRLPATSRWISIRSRRRNRASAPQP